MKPKKSPIPIKIASEHKELMTKIGKGIKKLRDDDDKRLIEMANEIEISRNEYSQLEQGKIYFKFSTLLRVLDYHKISFSDFIKNL
jgi:transcriptional regulator with XRE-family HTH domain